MKRTYYKISFGLIRKMFMGLSISITNASNHTKCVSLSSQNVRFNLLLSICPFTVKLDKFAGSCNTLNYLSNKICVPNEIKI